MNVNPRVSVVRGPAPILAGYLRLATRRYGYETGPVEEPIYVRAAEIQTVEAHYADGSQSAIGSTLTLRGGGCVRALQSVDAVLALLSATEEVRRGN